MCRKLQPVLLRLLQSGVSVSMSVLLIHLHYPEYQFDLTLAGLYHPRRRASQRYCKKNSLSAQTSITLHGDSCRLLFCLLFGAAGRNSADMSLRMNVYR